ncbi:MAG: DUF4330 family protein [Oscillospiraceae bacterium]|jgi:hypothetical protein|nr:DUF4330 family protein [Oscillospiraceae bacterium]
MRKIKWKLNFFDVVIIAAALVAAYIGYRALNSDRGGSPIIGGGRQATVRYTLELANLYRDQAEAIKKGDTVIEIVEKRVVGVIASEPLIEQYVSTSENEETGNTVMSPVPDRWRVTLVIDMDAVETSSEYTSNGFVLRAGANLAASGPGWAGTGVILDIEREAAK